MGKRELLVSLASIVCAATVSAQSRQITGTIVSENGEPVVGASIVVVQQYPCQGHTSAHFLSWHASEGGDDKTRHENHHV